jgi:hypothetical protein
MTLILVSLKHTLNTESNYFLHKGTSLKSVFCTKSNKLYIRISFVNGLYDLVNTADEEAQPMTIKTNFLLYLPEFTETGT